MVLQRPTMHTYYLNSATAQPGELPVVKSPGTSDVAALIHSEAHINRNAREKPYFDWQAVDFKQLPAPRGTRPKATNLGNKEPSSC
jgi:hypothetical protein